MKTELEKQIEALKLEHEHKTTTSEKLGDIKHLAYLSEWKDKTSYVVNADCKNMEEAKKVLTEYKPTNKNTVIGTASDKYYKDLKTPFKVTIKNPPVQNSAQAYELKISYESDKHDVTITMPIEYIKDMVKTEERHITSSEYHYFIGMSHERLRTHRVRCYKFVNVLNDEVINWYGGDQTLCKVKLIETIINRILTA